MPSCLPTLYGTGPRTTACARSPPLTVPIAAHKKTGVA
jgi:hypothetical protein